MSLFESWKCCTLPRLESINSLQCVHGFDLTGSASLWRGCFPMTLNSNIFGKLPRGSLSTRHAQSWSPKRSNNHHRLHCKNHDHNLTMSTISIQLACQDLLGQKEHAVLSLCSLSFLVSWVFLSHLLVCEIRDSRASISLPGLYPLFLRLSSQQHVCSPIPLDSNFLSWPTQKI